MVLYYISIPKENFSELIAAVIVKQQLTNRAANMNVMTLTFGNAITVKALGGYIDAKGTDVVADPVASPLVLATSLKMVANEGKFINEQNRERVKDLAKAMVYLP